MSPSRKYRLTVYLLDPYKRKVLLVKGKEEPYEGKLVPISFLLPENQFPQEIIQGFFRDKFKVDIEFIFHETSMPAVLDPNTIQTVAPFFTQVSSVATGDATVDFVYLAFAVVPFKLGDPLFSWCRPEDLVGRIAPKHVKRTVKHIIQLNQK